MTEDISGGEPKLADMDAAGVGMQVISLTAPEA